jgi:predicted ATP-grasp superfamily ATP-dependent carboligase
MEEETLLTVLRGRDRLPRSCRIPFAPAALIETVRDKGAFMGIAAEAGIPVPETREPRGPADLEGCARDLGWPLVVKPRIGTGARGVAYLDGPEGLLPAWRAASRPGLPAILQERLPPGGTGIGVSVLCAKGGDVIASFSHRRVREYPPTGGSSTCRESVRVPGLERRARRLLAAISWEGVAMLEFREDGRTGEYLLLELNPRFWGSLSLPIRCGVDFPDLLARWAMGEDLRPMDGYRLGVRGRTLLPGDILHILRARRRDWGGFLSLAGRSVHFDFCSMDDPIPGVARVASLIPAMGGGWWGGRR